MVTVEVKTIVNKKMRYGYFHIMLLKRAKLPQVL